MFLYVLPLLCMGDWISDLQEEGWTVQEGVYDFFSTETCAHADTCYAINPLTPYGLAWLPSSPKETNEGNYTNSCHIHNLCKTINGRLYSSSWRLAPGEVIAFVGTTPPKSTYWSFSNYLYTRFHPAHWKSNATMKHRIVGCKSTGEVGARCEIFSGINDPLNMQTFQLPQGSVDPFNAPMTILLTTDSRSEGVVANKISSGSDEIVNTLRFPGSILNLGVTSGKEDEMLNVLRVEGVEDPEEREQFYKKAPIQAYRLSPPDNFHIPNNSYFHTFDGKMRTRWTGIKEHGGDVSYEDLTSSLSRLEKAVISQHHTLKDYTVVQFRSFVNDSGYECIYDGSKCQGDCRDTIYAKGTLLPQEMFCNATVAPCKPSRFSKLSANPFDRVFVIGINHKLTNQSLYGSLTAYNYPKLASGTLIGEDGKQTYTIMQNEDLSDSAVSYLKDMKQEDRKSIPYLYVLEFARSCGGRKFCYEIADENTTGKNVLPITLDSPVIFLERMYIRPGTKSGPAVAETILPKLIHFLPRV